MPLTENKKIGIAYLIQPPFTPQLGIYGKISEAIEKEFYSALENKYKYISIEVNATHLFDSSKTKAKRTFIINLQNNFSYNSNTKRNISKAVKEELIFESVKSTEIAALSKKLINPFLIKKLKLKNKDIQIFDKLLQNCIAQYNLYTFIIKTKSGKICAIAHFICNQKHVVYLKGTSFDRNSGSMHFLMNKVIQFFREKNLKLFDFGGGQSDSMAQFYSGFGAKPLNYKTYKINNLPKAIKWLKS